MQRVAIAGASGRMGRMLIDAVVEAMDMKLCAALERPDSPSLGSPAAGNAATDQAASGMPAITSDVAAALAECDVLIDFTHPAATLANLATCVTARVNLVIGTTGFDAAGLAAIRQAAASIAIVFAPNMSVGVNVLFKLIGDAARALSDSYDVEIIEAHHRHKVDAPSGTALHIGEIVANAVDRNLDDVATFQRHGQTGARDARTIGFSAIRGGDIVGDHTVLFAGSGERIEITHRASSRAGYAHGAVLAARFLAGRDRGLFDMQDVLGLR